MPNRARPDLGGGRSVMGVPTANSRFSGIWLTAFLTGQSLALRKSQNGGSNRRRRAISASKDVSASATTMICRCDSWLGC